MSWQSVACTSNNLDILTDFGLYQRLIVISTRDYLQSLRNVQAAISVHSFGNVLIYPWGYKVTIEDDGGMLVRAVRNIRKSNKKTLSTWDGNVDWNEQQLTGVYFSGVAAQASSSPCFPCQRDERGNFHPFFSCPYAHCPPLSFIH